MQLLNHPYIYIPAKDGHDECHCWEHVTHGTREGGGCELQSGIVEVLINHWPVNQVNNQYVIFLPSRNRSSISVSVGNCQVCLPKKTQYKKLHENGKCNLGSYFPAKSYIKKQLTNCILLRQKYECL